MTSVLRAPPSTSSALSALASTTPRGTTLSALAARRFYSANTTTTTTTPRSKRAPDTGFTSASRHRFRVDPRLQIHTQKRLFGSSPVRMSAEEPTKGGVHVLESKAAWEEALKQDDNLVVLDCHATWCGPCKMIAPQVVKFSQKYENARFYKVDVDDVPDLAQELGIRAMPTFVFFKKGEKLTEVVGANPKALEAAIESGIEDK